MSARKRPRPARARRRRRRRPVPPDDEARTLALARDLAAIAGDRAPVAALAAALDRLAARGPAGPPEPGRRHRPAAEARALALGWAREQARLALRDVLDRAAKAGAVRTDLDPDTLAWLLLAAGEALRHEPPDAVPDRLRALLDLVRPAAGDRGRAR